MDEADASVGARQMVQDVAVKHKDTMHAAAMPHGHAQRRVVVHTQVPTQPHQTPLELLLHDRR
jgi:hypothetical protein